MLFGKLSTAEIKKALDKIRAEYDHLIVHYSQTTEPKLRFEERVRQADLRRFDMTTFVGLEMKTVKELLAQAEEKLRQDEIEAARPAKPALSYADRVLLKLQAQIKGYPALDIHPEASPDVAKLYGTLDWFKLKVWPEVLPVLRQKDPNPSNLQLEDELIHLTPYQGRLPKELDAYRVTLASQPSLSHLTKAQNRCILQAAQHLHRLRERVGQAAAVKLTPREQEMLAKTLAFLDKVIADFRLKDLRGPDA